MSLISFPAWHRSTLPNPLTPLVGRTRDVEHVETLLRTASYRLVTLIGPGGVGKTRLALHVAMELMNDFIDGVVFVPLSPIRDPSLVLPTIGQALGIQDVVDVAFDQRLANLLGAQQLLLVLDNFEQVVPAAASIATILSACPRITFLITSQSPLGIVGEQQVRVLPLPTPGTDDTATEEILRFDAVELFVQRARAVSSSLVLDDDQIAVIAAICRKLDGLPLAIELAAARLNILSPEALLARLSNRLQVLAGERRDVPDRLRTMRQAIAWSYDLLTPAEQDLFRRLAVFSGGIPLEAVEAIASLNPGDQSTLSPLSALDLISRLVDHSLVQLAPCPAGDSRFQMLESLREYGLEQLISRQEEAEAQAAHAAWFEQLAANAATHITGQGQRAWLDRLEDEWANLRAALNWSLSAGREQLALQICASIWRFWSVRGLATEGREWMARTLHVNAEVRSTYHVEAFFGAGYLAEEQNDLEVALRYFQKSLDLANLIDDAKGAVKALSGLGTVYHDRGEFPRALAFHTRAKAMALEAGDDRGLAVALGNMGTVHYFQGKYEQTQECWEECKALVGTLGDTQGEAIMTSNLGTLMMERGDLERARELLTRTLILQRQLGDKRSTAFTLTNLGEIWFLLNDFVLAGDFYAESIAILREAGDLRNEAIAQANVARLALAKNECAKAATILAESMQVLAGIGDVAGGVENIELLANVAVRCCAFAEAAELFGSSDAIRQHINAAVRVSLQIENEQGRSSACAALGSVTFEAARQVGQQLDFESASGRVAIIARRLIAQASDQPPLASTPVVTPPTHDHYYHLTERELEVLRLLADGCTTREIADALSISPRTASTHVTNIIGKLDVTSRTAAVAYAMRVGIV